MATTTETMRPSAEATREQLELGRQQGESLENAISEMTKHEAHAGGQQTVGDYIVGYAVESAEGLWHPRGGKLEWVEPTEENAHIEIAVRDAADGRFIPALDVRLTVLDAEGREVGTHRQPYLWHPWLYHYGRNWTVPGDGRYTLRVHIAAPEFARHDHVNGNRYADPVNVEFRDVSIKTGQKRS